MDEVTSVDTEVGMVVGTEVDMVALEAVTMAVELDMAVSAIIIMVALIMVALIMADLIMEAAFIMTISTIMALIMASIVAFIQVIHQHTEIQEMEVAVALFFSKSKSDKSYRIIINDKEKKYLKLLFFLYYLSFLFDQTNLYSK